MTTPQPPVAEHTHRLPAGNITIGVEYRNVDRASLQATYSGNAAHLAELEDETAAALLMKLKTKISAKILNEMSAARGAALVKRIARQRPSGESVQPQ